MKHIMIDLETLSTRQDAHVMAIGMVRFDADSIGEEIELIFDNTPGLFINAAVDPKTVDFWRRQPAAVRGRFFPGGEQDTREVLVRAAEFINAQPGSVVWGNGAVFDLGILKGLFERFSMAEPWDFRNALCYRTVMTMLPAVKEDEGVRRDVERLALIPHLPIDDCKRQIVYLQAANKRMALNGAGFL